MRDGTRWRLMLALAVVCGSDWVYGQAQAGGDRPAGGATLPPTTVVDAPASTEAAPTMFAHPAGARYLIQGQTNIIFQAHAPFHSPYAGVNSLVGRGEYKTSLVGTLYLGAELVRGTRFHTDAIVDFEAAGGRGISEALGLGGFTNLDVVRNPNLGSKPYLARVQLHGTVGLGGGTVEVERTPFSLATEFA